MSEPVRQKAFFRLTVDLADYVTMPEWERHRCSVNVYCHKKVSSHMGPSHRNVGCQDIVVKLRVSAIESRKICCSVPTPNP